MISPIISFILGFIFSDYTENKKLKCKMKADQQILAKWLNQEISRIQEVLQDTLELMHEYRSISENIDEDEENIDLIFSFANEGINRLSKKDYSTHFSSLKEIFMLEYNHSEKIIAFFFIWKVYPQ